MNKNCVEFGIHTLLNLDRARIDLFVSQVTLIIDRSCFCCCRSPRQVTTTLTKLAENIPFRHTTEKVYRARKELVGAGNDEIERLCVAVKETPRKDLLDNRR